jgi:putative FmdB family regulatory protein
LFLAFQSYKRQIAVIFENMADQPRLAVNLVHPITLHRPIMPIFEFKCATCDKEFETLVRSSAPAPECPSCHGSDLHKKMSTFSAVSKSAFGAVSSSATLDTLPAGCAGCGSPDGPGSCQF